MTVVARDQQHVWHPFTQHQTASPPVAMVKGQGAYLYDEQGKRYLDMVSSWWLTLHGHCTPEIAQAIAEQAHQLEHVMFGGFTHAPAVDLAEQLLALLPKGFTKVFYSDSGSTAVEVGVKMAYQYWHNVGEVQRKRIVAFEQAYHGDTFGAMAVGKGSGFHTAFHDLLFSVTLFPYPNTWLHDETVVAREQAVLRKLSAYLAEYGQETAAIIIEPLVQGASGMRMCRPEFLRQLEICVREHGVLIIYDEVFTGFGRTGEWFACHKAQTSPDIICLAKALTGGFLPLAVTACQEHIYQAFLGNSFQQALAHGHSYTANPLGCAAALASLKLLQTPATRAQLQMISQVHNEVLSSLTQVDKPRFCGTIAAFDLKVATDYGSDLSRRLRDHFLQQGLIVRPLGDVIYFVPPYCITESELKRAYDIVLHELEGVLA